MNRAARACMQGFVLLTGAFAVGGCVDRPIAAQAPVRQGEVRVAVANDAPNRLDLLLMVDNSASMRDNQQHLMSQFRTMMDALVHPPCVNATNPSPHACVAGTDDQPQYPAVADLHVGIVSSDLGTPGYVVPTCDNSTLGDDGLLDPLATGAAEAVHETWLANPPPNFRPADCASPSTYPAYLTFNAATDDPNAFVDQVQCVAGLYVGGCGLESQLESAWRALHFHDARAPMGANPNGGFLREDALLAIVMLTDEEDGSVRNCDYADGAACDDARSVYDAHSMAWSNALLNLRFYMYQPGGPQDPTWSVDRYINPNDPTAGFLSLKPGHPERVLFAAITGVPLTGWQSGADGSIDWDALLGDPDPNDVNNFYGRNTGAGSHVIDGASAEGPISMRQANADPNCAQNVVPACRREGSTYAMSCTTDAQYFAWPSRRIVEVARRFDQAPLCNGGPCHNGIVASICANDYTSAMQEIVQRIGARFQTPCLPHPLATQTDVAGNVSAQCDVHVLLPVTGSEVCDAAHGEHDPLDANGVAAATYQTGNGGVSVRVCVVDQLSVSPTTELPVDATAHGWYYTTTPAGTCAQRVVFTDGDAPPAGASAQLECIEQYGSQT